MPDLALLRELENGSVPVVPDFHVNPSFSVPGSFFLEL